MSEQQQRDKVTVGLTGIGRDHLDRVMETKWFDERMDAYRLAIAVAVGRDLEVPSELPGVETMFNVGSLDRDGNLRALLLARNPDVGRPYEYAERLAEVGMRFLREGLVDAQQTLTSLVGGDESTMSPGDVDSAD
jgi:hypothetical protein